MAFEIEEVGKDVSKWVKKNWPIALAVAGGGGLIIYFFTRDKAEEPVEDYLMAYPSPPPEQEFPTGGEYDEVALEQEMFEELLNEIAAGQQVEMAAMAEALYGTQEQMSSWLEEFSSVVAAQGERIKSMEAGLQSMYQYAPPQAYIQQQQAQLPEPRGYAMPVSELGGGKGGGYVVTQTAEQMLEFMSGGSRNVGGSYSLDYRDYQPAGAVDTRAAVSKVTGKTGSVEQQLTGLSGAEKLAVLREAGLVN